MAGRETDERSQGTERISKKKRLEQWVAPGKGKGKSTKIIERIDRIYKVFGTE